MPEQLPRLHIAPEQIFNAIHCGLIVVDTSQVVLMCNEWVEKRSGVAAATCTGMPIGVAFGEAPARAFLNALDNTLKYGLPVVLSNALHRSPLALYDFAEPATRRERLHQSISLTPLLGADKKRYCLIQISDASAAIKREKMLRSHSEVLKREATTDSLTGLYNRRFFDEHYKIVLGHAIRHHEPLSILMIDIDFFKEYNDCYGHLAGDKVLAQVAGNLKQQLQRATDVVARYGGEEFVLMLPNLEGAAALLFAEKLRLAVEAMHIPHEKSKLKQQLSVSVGISTFNQEPGSDCDILLKSADTALYQAKKNGRNQSYFLPLAQFHALEKVEQTNAP